MEKSREERTSKCFLQTVICCLQHEQFKTNVFPDVHKFLVSKRNVSGLDAVLFWSAGTRGLLLWCGISRTHFTTHARPKFWATPAQKMGHWLERVNHLGALVSTILEMLGYKNISELGSISK